MGLQGESLIEIRPPVFQGLVGKAVDEVQRDSVESGLESLFDGALRLQWRMLPAEKLKVLATEGLHAETDEIETKYVVPYRLVYSGLPRSPRPNPEEVEEGAFFEVGQIRYC